MRKVLGVVFMAVVATWGFMPSATATIHPIVESADCANAAADAAHPLGDVAEPPGVTPGEGNHSANSDVVSLIRTSDGFTDPNPAWSGFKVNGACGRVGQ